MMNFNDYDLIHRRYYIDHPSSLSHREPYITSLENQYSVLSRSHNPYHVLDHLNFQFSGRNGYQNPSMVLKNESLESQMREWNRRQHQKENSYRSLKHELRELNRELRYKEKEFQMQRMKDEMRSIANQSRIMPLSMVIPNNGCMCQQHNVLGSRGLWNSSLVCNHMHQCQCNCHNRNACACQNTIQRQSRVSVQKYKPVISENTQTDTVKSIKPAQTSLASISSKPKIASKDVIKLQKKKQSHLLSRFRICAYAVYFCIYFKWFSFQFSLNRYNQFKLRYLVDSGKEITNAYKEVYAKLLGIDIPNLIRTAAENVPEKKEPNNINISTLLKKEGVRKLQKLEKYKLLSRNNQTLFLRCSEFISLLFEKAESVFGEWEWGEYGNALGIGALNLSYMIDNYFLPHELYLMTFHDGKGYAQISPSHQRIQVMIKIVVKMLLYNVCLQLDNNREWLDEHQKQLDIAEDKNQIFIFLEICSKMIFIICQYLYQRELKGHDTNYDDVSEKFKVQPCNPIVYSYSISKRRQLFKDKDIKDSNLLIFGIQQLDQINDIMQEPFFRNEKNRIISSINAFVEQVLDKLQDSKRQLFQQIKQETLNNEYIVLRGVKKVMKSTRYYPFVSGSVINSKERIDNNTNEGDLTSYKPLKKSSRKIKKDKSDYNISAADSVIETLDNNRSTISKTSIMNKK